MDAATTAQAPEYKSKAKEFWARLFRGVVNGALAYGAFRFSSDPKWAVLAPVVTGPLGKVIRLALPPDQGWKVPF